MKIIFLCSSFEEGKDGIGDYTRKLAKSCLNHGIKTYVIAVNDSYTNIFISGIEDGVPFYRFPKKSSWFEKEKQVLEIIGFLQPIDWISIQFISYGFNPKGILFREIAFFKKIAQKPKIHVMVHELWIGEEKGASFKRKTIGIIQKYGIRQFFKAIRPNITHTSTEIYNKMLQNLGQSSSLLPLFSGITKIKTDPTEYEQKIPKYLIENRNQYIIGTLFGSIYSEYWDLSELLTLLIKEKNLTGKKVIITSIGKISVGKMFWETLHLKYSDIEFLTLGPQEEKFISHWFNYYTDFGIATTPTLLLGKSSSYMAFCEHGIPIICKKNDISFRFKMSDKLILKNVTEIDKKSFFRIQERFTTQNLLEISTSIFLNALTNI